jgi:hypothetical protein
MIVVQGRGIFDLPFIESSLAAIAGAECRSFARLLDLRQAAINLSRFDLRAMDVLFEQFWRGQAPARVAILAGLSPLTLDMAVLLKQRADKTSPRVRVFTQDEEAARAWLIAPQLPRPRLVILPKS